MRYWRFYVDREIVSLNPKTRRRVKPGTKGSVEEGGDHVRVVDVLADDPEQAREKIDRSDQALAEGEAFGEVVEIRPTQDEAAAIHWIE